MPATQIFYNIQQLGDSARFAKAMLTISIMIIVIYVCANFINSDGF